MFLQNSNGQYIQDSSLLPDPLPGTVHARKVVVGDFTGDGVPDFLIADHGLDQPPFPGATPLLMSSNGAKFVQQPIPNVPTGFQHSASAADIRGEGTLDVVVTDATNGAFYLMNEGKGDFTVTRDNLPTNPSIGQGYYTSELIEIDGDGYVDLVVGGHEQDGAVMKVFWSDTNGTFSNARRTDIPGDPTYQVVLDIVAEDTDGDGDAAPDLRAMDNSRNILYLNDGKGNFTRAQ